ncbi:hypothetical protein HanRHA438_Chr03g0104771 [Helianthus annuus]|uniref:Transmembrane protein n=1 Tax=Helianthus annuus TaxID=4232 RepID=A0A9K3JDG4_HELAN|nr:hypothetical protein HanXRQr2_Chr03g0093621 [Helianthus annuus]KAJ0591866.1 hypothetical protein HanHA300_Chr03g0078261 [Helianthus annuus]KAJ0599209.1 hypothetical protein HanIR_Chr03g0102301 [Helianthus annuus]KAJ0606839.1 hypothetical protein HanHA89_Chr03g0089671 [Helianthus annuus]KAJ0766900.1 hypothetical protein HanLR1_Chr03g0082901 [Helianthus annuus]
MVRLGNVMKQGDKQPLAAEAMAKDQVLHQTKKGAPKSPISMMLCGFAVIGGLAYFTLYSHKKPEATALDVAKVATGTASTANTRPQK